MEKGPWGLTSFFLLKLVCDRFWPKKSTDSDLPKFCKIAILGRPGRPVVPKERRVLDRNAQAVSATDLYSRCARRSRTRRCRALRFGSRGGRRGCGCGRTDVDGFRRHRAVFGASQVPAGVNSIGKTPTKDLTYDPSDEALKKNEKVLKFDGQKPREMYMQQVRLVAVSQPSFMPLRVPSEQFRVPVPGRIPPCEPQSCPSPSRPPRLRIRHPLPRHPRSPPPDSPTHQTRIFWVGNFCQKKSTPTNGILACVRLAMIF